MKRCALAGLVVWAALAIGCATKPNEKLCSPDLLAGKARIKTVAVVPAEVSIKRSAVAGNEELFEMDADVAKLLEGAARRALRSYDFEVAETGLDAEAVAQDPDLKRDVASIQDKCMAISISTEPLFFGSDETRISDTRIQNGELNIGFDVAPVAQAAGADALLVIHSGGMIHSAGKQALGMAAALGGVQITYYDVVYYRAFLVDGDDGTVMAVFFGGASLDQFVMKSAMPGGEDYKSGLERLDTDLATSVSRSMGKTLERTPK